MLEARTGNEGRLVVVRVIRVVGISRAPEDGPDAGDDFAR